MNSLKSSKLKLVYLFPLKRGKRALREAKEPYERQKSSTKGNRVLREDTETYELERRTLKRTLEIVRAGGIDRIALHACDVSGCG